MKHSKLVIRSAAAALACLCLTAGAALAAGGSQSDPLISLSYLTQTATPAILEQVDQRAAQYQQELTDALAEIVRGYAGPDSPGENPGPGEAPGPGGEESASSYTVVTLTNGQVLSMEIGCEVMLRIGSAVCQSPDAPGLIDTTDGSTLNNNGSLAVNHLYMATIVGRSIRATGEVVKVLVRGSYTIL